MKFLRCTYLYITATVALFFLSCNKLVEVDVPVTYVTGESVYDSRETAIAYVTGIYAKMIEGPLTGTSISALSLLPGLSADEIAILPAQRDLVLQAYYRNHLTPLVGSVTNHFWNILYSYVYMVNSAIDGLRGTSLLDKLIKEQLLGEVLFLRAFFYFYLINLYGDVPLLLTPDYLQNGVASRTPKDVIYKQIVADLTEAKTLLNKQYLEGDLATSSSGTKRVRPTRNSAAALLARVYLYLGNYSLAESESYAVINERALYSLAVVDKVFKADNTINKESIWQLQPVLAGRNTQDAWLFILPTSGPTSDDYGANPVFLNNLLVNSFEENDLRKLNWIDSVTVDGVKYSFPFKYKNGNVTTGGAEHSIVLRLSEQYLICAEARARLKNLSGADEMLNVVRARAGLTNITSVSENEAIKAIMHEKQVELFSEWGHRWMDLKRTGLVDQVMQAVTPLKSGDSWRSFQQWYPIPNDDMILNPGLAGQQNSGY